MSQQIEYMIVMADNAHELERNVNTSIDKDWRPVGGLSVVAATGRHNYGWSYHQAMIRENR